MSTPKAAKKKGGAPKASASNVKQKKINALSLEDHLVAFAKGQLRSLGPELGPKYVKRCHALWLESYGSEVANKIMAKMGLPDEAGNDADESPQPSM